MIWFAVSAVVLIILLGVGLVITIKVAVKKDKEIKGYRAAIEQQKRIIYKFQEAECEAKEKKDKLGKGSTSDRVNASVSVLQDLEAGTGDSRN